MTMVWRTLKYLQHQFYLKHRRGFGIHSPYLYGFVDQVLYNAKGWRVPPEVLAIHREMKKDRTPLDPGTNGAGSRIRYRPGHPGLSTRSAFVRRASVSEKYGALLCRTSRWFGPEAVVETGTGLGISSLYMGSGAPGVPLHTIEGNPERAHLARELHRRAGMANCAVHLGGLESGLEKVQAALERHEPYRGRLLAFVDADHRFGPTLEVVRFLMEMSDGEAVIVLDDIYWSRGMHRAWKEITSWPRVRTSIDLFHMGILLFRQDIHATRLKLNF